MDSQTSPGQFRDIPDSYERSPEDNALFKPMISIEGQPLSYVENISNSSVDSEEGSAKSMPILSKLPTNQKRAGGMSHYLHTVTQLICFDPLQSLLILNDTC